MDTIRNYLESMFAHLPATPEVVRAKTELGQMMEDKYSELIEEGRTENEAVGIVISEFGNLDELAEELGIRSFMEQAPEPDETARAVPFEEVKDFLAERTRQSYMSAFGIFFLIIAAVPVIILGSIPMGGAHADGIGRALMAVGLILMFLLLAGGLGLLIYSGMQSQQHKYLWRENLYFDFSTQEYIRMEYKEFQSTKTLLTAVGIVMCVLCALPPFIVSFVARSSNLFVFHLAGAITLFIAGVAVFLFVLAGRQKGSFGKLMRIRRNTPHTGTMGVSAGEAADGTAAGQRSDNMQTTEEIYYDNEILEKIMPVWWPTVTALYLIVSFLTFSWGITWVIWPIAAIVHAFIRRAFGRHIYA
ncbi:MAG: hypothetical protein E7236_05740 [Lachnospiraceae bacterium]|nr:hypothetical protein [Lachnospiraceae bacterium]